MKPFIWERFKILMGKSSRMTFLAAWIWIFGGTVFGRNVEVVTHVPACSLYWDGEFKGVTNQDGSSLVQLDRIEGTLKITHARYAPHEVHFNQMLENRIDIPYNLIVDYTPPTTHDKTRGDRYLALKIALGLMIAICLALLIVVFSKFKPASGPRIGFSWYNLFMNFKVWKKIDHFIIKKKIGEGGMAEVFHVYDLHTKRDAALKKMLPTISKDNELSKKFKYEAKILKAITKSDSNAPVVNFIDSGKGRDGLYYLAMEYLQGPNIERYMNEHTINLFQADSVIIQICEALIAAYKTKLMECHRDLAPDNFMLTGKMDDHFLAVKLIDFGVAKATAINFKTAQMQHFGKLLFCSPEQLMPNTVLDQRSDIFSLGITFYFILEGKLPWYSKSDYGFLITKKEAPRRFKMPIPNPITTLIYEMIRYDPTERPQTLDELVKRIREYEANITEDDNDRFIKQRKKTKTMKLTTS